MYYHQSYRVFFHVTQDFEISESFLQHAQSHLVEVEENYVQLMHHGIQCYSRPLRHAVLSSDQHSEMFQNIEKVRLS